MSGLYVHVPFCAALCPYCDFAVVVGKRDMHRAYCDALIEEARAHAWDEPVTSVFVGGGTPTALDAKLLGSTLRQLLAVSGVAEESEVTVECNPEGVSIETFTVLDEAGVNRISIGAQSLVDRVLGSLGRSHSAEAASAAVASARAAGIANVSIDLIYGGPGERLADWRTTLDRALALEPDHLSCYALTIEERTPFGRAVARGTMRAPDEDDLAEKYEHAVTTLDAVGYRHYEISNWARPGYESRHNVLYWSQGDYVGLGLGAHSHRSGHRWWNTRSLTEYLRAPADARAGEERLDEAQRIEERLSLRMRLLDPIHVDTLERALGTEVAAAVTQLEQAGLATLDGAMFALTSRGMLLENEVTSRFLALSTR